MKKFSTAGSNLPFKLFSLKISIHKRKMRVHNNSRDAKATKITKTETATFFRRGGNVIAFADSIDIDSNTGENSVKVSFAS